MELRSPFFVEDLWKDQPYSSMLLVVPKCDFKCVGCQHKYLEQEEVKDFEVKDLVKIYNENPFFKGITLAGLEPLFSGENFWKDLEDFIVSAKIENVTIYTRFDIENNKIQKIIKQMLSINQISNFYLKYGRYIENSNSKTINIDNWEVVLASDNQNFIKLKEEKLLSLQ